MRLIWILIFLNALSLKAQILEYKPTQLDNLINNGDRRIVVFFSADWCKICHMMKETSLKDNAVERMLNEQFYFVNIQEEFQENVTISGQVFSYRMQGSKGYHELTSALNGGRKEMVYPSLKILDPDLSIIYEKEGFLDNEELLHLLSIAALH